MKRILLILGSTGVILMVGLWYHFSYQSSSHAGQYEQCKKLHVGMNVDQVQSIMGTPEEMTKLSSDSTVTEIWYYDKRPHLASMVYCSFDSTMGLIDFSCGD